jgi:hypothetical protein
MAILKKGSPDSVTEEFEINNGDLKALQEIAREWGFRDEVSVLRFALAVLKQAPTHSVYVENEEGEKVGLQPADHLRQPQPDVAAS